MIIIKQADLLSIRIRLFAWFRTIGEHFLDHLQSTQQGAVEGSRQLLLGTTIVRHLTKELQQLALFATTEKLENLRGTMTQTRCSEMLELQQLHMNIFCRLLRC